MTPTKTQVTEEEYHECSSDTCPDCGLKFYVMASGWSITLAYECPHCEALVKAAALRNARKGGK